MREKHILPDGAESWGNGTVEEVTKHHGPWGQLTWDIRRPQLRVRVGKLARGEVQVTAPSISKPNNVSKRAMQRTARAK